MGLAAARRRAASSDPRHWLRAVGASEGDAVNADWVGGGHCATPMDFLQRLR